MVVDASLKADQDGGSLPPGSTEPRFTAGLFLCAEVAVDKMPFFECGDPAALPSRTAGLFQAPRLGLHGQGPAPLLAILVGEEVIYGTRTKRKPPESFEGTLLKFPFWD